MSNRVISNVGISKDISERVKALGILKERSSHWLMVKAIQEYVKKHEIIEELKRETAFRWEEAERGKIISHKEIYALLKKWVSLPEQDLMDKWEITWLESAAEDLKDLMNFMKEKNMVLKSKLTEKVMKSFAEISEFPFLGKPLLEMPQYREKIIYLGALECILRYRCEENTVFVVWFKRLNAEGLFT